MLVAGSGIALLNDQFAAAVGLTSGKATALGTTLAGSAVVTGVFFYLQSTASMEQSQRDQRDRQLDRARDIDWQLSQERDLRGMSLEGRDLTQVALRLKNISDGLFSGAILNHVDMSFTSALRTSFVNARMQAIRANSDSKFDDADFSGADLSHAQMNGASMRRARFLGANLSHGVFTNCDLHEADFRGADLKFADLRTAKITGCNFENADTKGTMFPRLG